MLIPFIEMQWSLRAQEDNRPGTSDSGSLLLRQALIHMCRRLPPIIPDIVHRGK